MPWITPFEKHRPAPLTPPPSPRSRRRILRKSQGPVAWESQPGRLECPAFWARALGGRGARSLVSRGGPAFGQRTPRTWPAPLPSRTSLGGCHTFCASGGHREAPKVATVVEAPAWRRRAPPPGAQAGRVVHLLPILMA